MNTLEKLEKKYDIELPNSYKNWFNQGGANSEFFIGTDMDEPYLSDLNEWAQDLLVESGSIYQLPDNCFVFAMHQGYQFMYFLCDGHDDPEIWYFIEGEKEPVIKWDSFSKFLCTS